MPPVCDVRKEIYVPSPEPHVGASVSVAYAGRGLRREEVRSLIRSSDWSDTIRRRISDDNGRTWSDWELLHRKWPVQGEFTQEGGASQDGTGLHDPASGRMIKPVFQRIVRGDPREAMHVLWSGDRRFSDHGFCQVSGDEGRTWGPARQFRYEDGPEFDPGDWGAPGFWRTNEMYIGRAAALSNGTVVISATVPVPHRDPEDEKVRPVFPNDYREGCVAGAMTFVGRWNPAGEDYDWTPSQPVFVPRRASSRGLVELDLAELKNGGLLMIMRGSNTGLDPVACPGRKWFSVSRDGGLTWSRPSDIRYDTGESVYSPASISQTIRSARTGRLYWVGNITETPPDGNSPRYPLRIVEIDEDRPAFRKDTVTLIDDRDPARDSPHVQLSNFSLLEDRESLSLELYMTRLGERGGGDDTWTADAFRYTLTF